MTDTTRNTLPASLTELARIAKQYSLDTARWHQGSHSLDFHLYTRGDGGDRFNFSGINEDEAYALAMIFQALPVLLEMAAENEALKKRLHELGLEA